VITFTRPLLVKWINRFSSHRMLVGLRLVVVLCRIPCQIPEECIYIVRYFMFVEH
jgi:hypothetical protein